MRWLGRSIRLGLQARITALTTIGLAAVFVVMGFIGLRSQSASMNVVLEQRQAVAETVAAHVDYHIGYMLDELAAAAAEPGFDLTDADLAPEQAALSGLYRAGMFTYDVFVTDARGVVLAVEPETLQADLVGMDFAVHPHIRRALETGQPQASGLISGVAASGPLISLVVPIKNANGEITGLIGGAFDPGGPAISGFLGPIALGETGYAQVVDGQGMVIASTIADRVGKPTEHLDLILSLMQRGEPTVSPDSLVTEAGEEFHEVIAFAPISRFGWGVTVEQDRAEALAPIIQARDQILLAAAVTLALAVLFVWSTTRRVTRPVLALTWAARRIASGDLATPVAVGGPDEVAELAGSFETMRGRLAAWGEELEAAVQKRTRQLSVLYAIDRAAAGSLELEQILNDAVERVLEVLEVEAGGIYLLEADGETMTVSVHRGLSDEFVENTRRIRLGEGISGRAVAERRPVILDVADYPTERLAPFIVSEGFQTLASTPLVSAGELVGALNLGTRRQRAFPPEEMELLTAIGRQLGGALANARLHEDTRRQATQLGLLYDAGLTINRALDPRVQLEFLCKIAMTAVHADRAEFFRCDAAASQMRFEISAGYSKETQKALTGLTFPMGEERGLVGRVAQNRLPLYLPEVSADPRWITIDSEIRSVLWVPVLHEKELLGTLGVSSARLNAFTPHDERLLVLFANQVAVAMENTRLLETEQRRGARLTAIQQLGTELAGLREESAVLNTLVRRTAALADSPTCTVMLVDEAVNEAVLAAQHGLPEGTPTGLRVPLSLPVIRRSLESGEPIILPNIDRNAVEMGAILVRRDIRAFFAYPMMREGRALGFITLSSLTPRRPSADEVTAYRLLAERAAAALENARLYAQVQQSLARITNLYELSTEILATTTMEETAAVIACKVSLATGAHSAMINLIDPEGQVALRIGADAQGRLPPEPPPRPSGTTMTIFRAGEPLIVTGLDERRDPINPQLVEIGIKAFIGLPLKVGARVTGVLFVRYAEPRLFFKDEIQALTLYCNQAATALEKARLYAETQQNQVRLREQLEQLQAVYHVTEAVSRAEALEEIYEEALDSLQRTVNPERASILLLDAGGVMRFKASRGLSEDYQKAVEGHSPWSPDEPNPQPVLVSDVEVEPSLETQRAAIRAEGLRALAFIPLTQRGRLLGKFMVYYDAPHAFRDEEVQLIQAIAHEVAFAIERRRAEQSLLASEREYRTLVENATELIWTLDTEGRFTFVNRQAEAASGQKAEDWIGKSFAPLIAPPEDLPRIQHIFLKTLAGKPQSYEVGVYRSDGSMFHLSVNTTPLYRDGTIVGTISFGRDVTAQQEAEAALTQRMAELSALFEVSSALRGVEGVERMLQVIVDKAVECCRADCGSVLLLDESGEMLVSRYGTGARQKLVGARLQLGQGISGRVAQSGAPHLSSDFQHDPLLAFGPVTSARLPEIASDVCVPLHVGEQIVGAMHISSYAPRTFTEAEVRVLTAIADMAANAIHRAGLFEQLEHRVHELAALFDVGKMVTATLRIGDVLEFVASAATEAVHAEGSFISLWDEREERLVLRASQGLLTGEAGRRKYRLGEGLAGWVFLERQGVNAPDVAADPRWKREPEQEAPLASGRANSALIVPLIIGKKALGVLGVINKIGAPLFSASDEALLTTLAGQVAVAIENAHLYEDVRDVSIAAIRSLATAIDARDPYTHGHSASVSRLAVQLARELGWSSADLEMLEFAALLHDVGKIAVPDAVLRKVEPLTADEWNVIRLHPFHSAQIVKPVESLRRIVSWVYHHHERLDGTGYPDGLKGEAIPLASRIIAVADTFDAMTTDRPYRKARSVAEALAEIERNAGKQFDPAVAAAFLRMRDEK